MQLRFAHLVPDVWASLEVLPREGWVKRRIKNPETVAEHTYALLRLAEALLLRMPEFVGGRAHDLLSMLEVHDWPEARPNVGDEISLLSDSASKRDERYRREKAAMEDICIPIGGGHGNRIFGFWHRFTRSRDEVAVFARALDKYQAIERAYRYEQMGGPQGLGVEFLQGSPPIEHPLLMERFERFCTTST